MHQLFSRPYSVKECQAFLEGGPLRYSKQERSLDDKRNELQGELEERFGDGVPKAIPSGSAWIVDMYDDDLVYNREGKYFRIGYKESDGGLVLTGDPVEVRRKTVYEPINSDE